MADSPPDAVVIEVPWRHLNMWSAAIASGLFSLVLAAVAATSGQFWGVYRVVIAGSALVLAYACATFVINRTRLALDGEALSLSHGPLPWRRPSHFSRAVIARLHINPYSRRLELRTKLGEEHVLLEALPTPVVVRIDAAFAAVPFYSASS